jgi:hypothetical protein
VTATDQDLSDLRAKVIIELKTVSGSDAYPTTLIDNKLNEAYMAIFNQPKRELYLREGSVEFMSIADQQVTSQITAGDSTINIVSAAAFPVAGKVLIQEDMIAYTGKTGTSLTGCTGVNLSTTDNPLCRAVYPLATYLPDMDEQKIRGVLCNGIPLEMFAYERFLTQNQFTFYKYTLFDGNLILPKYNASQRVMINFFKELIPMSSDSDKPLLIPNVFRQMLVYYAVGVILMLDDKRTGWELYYNYNPQRPERSSGLYFEWLRNFFGKYARRVDEDRKRQASVYD